MSTERGPGQSKKPRGHDQARKRSRATQDRVARVLAEQHQRRVRQQRLAIAAIATAVVVVVVVAMVVVSRIVDSGTTAAPAVSGAAADRIVRQTTTLPAAILDQVGKGQVLAKPQTVTDQPALADAGKPLIVYIGAEYCPFCASQRWPVVVAMSRFGTFAGLGMTHSASDDVYPNTQSFSFHGSSYTSQYLAFQGVEVATNEREGNGYGPLDTLTPLQQQIMTTLNAPPYVDSSGAIPFMDFANQYFLLGGAYDAELLQKQSAEQIVAALRDPSDPIAQGIIGTANIFTTYLCQLTNGQPGDVCQSSAAQAYAEVL
ncbi:MAG: DUF929 family protein [Dactylosporangium sp.]|nr:DUF929 domain-containing protein [Dactylosporangium sp.]NNJ61250.1 DUF929 family protein [Dactylosporangium sp.]